MQAVAVKCQPDTELEQMHAQMQRLADKLDVMGQHVAAAHVSMAVDQLARSVADSRRSAT